MRAIVISEQLGPPLAEGIRKFATSLVAGLDTYCETIGIGTELSPETRDAHQGPAIGWIRGGKLFRNADLRYAIEQYAPDLVVYVPSASGTLFSFLRARQLKRIAPAAYVSMVLTQTRKHTAFSQMLLPRLAPNSVFAQSEANIRYLGKLGIEARFLPSGVDLDDYHPVNPEEKRRLRVKFRLPADDYLVLHAGHFTQARNTGLLEKLEGVGRGVMLAGAAGRDPQLKRQLESRGVIVIDSYVDKVEELYQAVDCYVFPTREHDAAMEFPLSVLEAMACDLPVVSYPYGGLPLALDSGGGLTFAESDAEMLDAIAKSKHVRANTRAQAEQFAWKNIAARVLEAAEVRDAGTVVAAL
ncbi:MAG: glycosyltransferase family 4 protein [Chloroflexota bacterium]